MASWQRLEEEEEEEEEATRLREERELKIMKRSVSRLQSSMRRRRWYVILRNLRNWSLHKRGFCGVILYPIRTHDGSLLGYEGRSRRRYVRGGGALPPEHPLRMLCISAVETATLERAVLFAILSNCLFMAAQGPPERYGFLPAEMSEKVELGYTLFFTVGASLPLVHARRDVITAADPAEASRPSPTRRQSSCSRSWRSARPATPSPTWPTGGTASTWWWWWRPGCRSSSPAW